MRKVLLNLFTVLVVIGIVLVGQTDARHRQRCFIRQCSPCCAAPQAACCVATSMGCQSNGYVPQASIPSVVTNDARGFMAGGTCLRLEMFKLVMGSPGICMYAADCYQTGCTAPVTCMWDGDCGQPVNQACPNCSPRFAVSSVAGRPGLPSPVDCDKSEAEVIADEHGKKGASVDVVVIGRQWVGFTANKPVGSVFVRARLLKIQWNDPRSATPKVFYVGFEVNKFPNDSGLNDGNVPRARVNNEDTGSGSRFVTVDGQSYEVRISLN